MAKQSWNTVVPTSGTAGTTTVTISATEHTGRNSRVSTVTFTTTEGSPTVSKTLSVTQLAKNILAGTASQSFVKEGEAVILSGIANTSKITLGISGTGFSLSNFQISKDDGTTWTDATSGTALSGDPGASNAYQWRVKVTVTANPNAVSRGGTLTVTPNSGEGTALTVTLTQAAADPTLTLSASTMSLAATGVQQTITVSSNTSYSIT
jgi:hypothetical protein